MSSNGGLYVTLVSVCMVEHASPVSAVCASPSLSVCVLPLSAGVCAASVCLYLSLCLCNSLCLSISVYVSVCLSLSLSLDLSVCDCLCLAVTLSVCLRLPLSFCDCLCLFLSALALSFSSSAIYSPTARPRRRPAAHLIRGKRANVAALDRRLWWQLC